MGEDESKKMRKERAQNTVSSGNCLGSPSELFGSCCQSWRSVCLSSRHMQQIPMFVILSKQTTSSR